LKFWKLPTQVVQLGVIFLIVIAAILLLRQRFVPESFGKYGHYRADAVDMNAAREIHFAGWEACVLCHPGQIEKKSNSYHRGVTCEACHGPAKQHTTDPMAHRPVVPTGREPCLGCHQYLPSRPTGFPQIIENRHNPLKPCLTCHDPHAPTPPERPGSCSACHAAIARSKVVSHHAPLECEVCHEVPPEHRDLPRAHQAQKPYERAFCGNCHAEGAELPTSVHGVDLDLSEYEIARVDPITHGGSYLCWQCHYQHSPEAR
jgi:hypothetical protein